MHKTAAIHPVSSPVHTISLGVVAAVVGAFVVWALIKPPSELDKETIVIVLDASPTNDLGRCQDLKQITTELTQSVPTDGQEFLLLATGDSTTGQQPVFFPPVKLEPSHRIAEGTSKAGKDRDAAINRLLSQCEQIRLRKESPNRAAVDAAVRTAQNLCPPARCRVIVRTDGLEEQDSHLVAALAGKEVGLSKSPIDNTGLEVVLCGASSITVKKNSRLPELAVVEKVWKQEFADPSRVQVLPSCVGVR
jgi:hypothetical protein